MPKKKKQARTKKKKPPRTELTRLKRHLAELIPGGTKDNAIEVSSASIVEMVALDRPCIGCGERVKLVDHTVVPNQERSLRSVLVRCPRCGTERAIYVEITRPLMN